jgi:hypothetical protein
VFENRTLKRAFVPKREGVTKNWRKLRTEELQNLYPSPNVIRTDKAKDDVMGGACRTHETSEYGNLVGKPEERRSRGRRVSCA